MQKIYLVILFFPLFLFSYKLSATHTRGGYLTVEELVPGSRKCRITLRMYLDTESGVPIGGSTDFLYFGVGNERIVMPEIVQGTQVPGATWTMIDATRKVALVVYSIMYEYPAYGMYTVSYSEVNRNQGVINMTQSVDTPFYTEARFTLAPGKQYTSPVLLTEPFFRSYAGASFSYSVSATDVNDYSLFYQLITPKGGREQDVQDYTLPEDVELNPFNGLITWDGYYKGLPAVGEFAFAAIIYQVQNNSIIGSTVVDFQVIMEDESVNGKLSDNKELNANNRIFVPVDGSFSLKVFAEDNADATISLEAFSELTAKTDNFSFTTYDSTHEAQKITVGVITLDAAETIVRDNPYPIAVRASFLKSGTKQTKDISYLFYSKDTEITELPDVLKEDEVLGTEEESFMSAYPNPVKDFLNLENFFKPGATAALYDLQGKKVLEQALQAGNTLLDTRHLEAGFYLVKIQYAGGVVKTVKVVKP